jgi:predicted phosphodiesterase
MRLWILSDLHRDMGVPWTPEAIPEADVAVVAGDVGEGIETSLDWLARTIRPHMRVVFVAGNHEYYRSCRPDALAAGRIAAARSGVDFLEDEATWIGDVAFAGCTLWTDYRLDGDGRVASSMDDARRMLADHRRIDRARRPAAMPFRPEDAAAVHRASRARLESLALDRACAGRPLNPAFASRLEGTIGRLGAAVWVHGHVHASRDHVVGRTRVVCNPKGYGRENRAFDPALVLDATT